MLTNFFSAIPLGVFPLFFGLVWLGHRASRDREVSATLIYALPLLSLLSLNRALSFQASDPALIALLVGMGCGAIWGYQAQKRWALCKTMGRVHLRGEWVTLAVLLGLFGVNFAAGVVRDVAPDLTASLGVATGFGGLSGLFSGTFVGRAIWVARVPEAKAPDIQP